MVRKYVMAALVVVMTVGSMQALVGRAQGEVVLDTKGNDFDINESKCIYNMNDNTVKCYKGSLKVLNFENVRTEHAGTREKSKANYIGKVKKDKPGAGLRVYATDRS